MKKGLGNEQITELVVSHRLRNVQDRKDRGPRAEGQKADHDHRESPPSSKASELSLGETKPVRANPWKMASKNHGDDGQKGLDEQNHRTLHRNN